MIACIVVSLVCAFLVVMCAGIVRMMDEKRKVEAYAERLRLELAATRTAARYWEDMALALGERLGFVAPEPPEPPVLPRLRPHRGRPPFRR